ncbi:MAG: PilX N-terminal domain-containing pilus assembly protein [Pseudomonas sp.]
MSKHFNPLPSKHQQQGATLFIALMLLLIITVLAVSNMREVTMETRLTGNLVEQKRLMSAAESGLREAEKRFSRTSVPPERCTSDSSNSPCSIADATSYNTNFSNSLRYQGIDGNTTLERNTHWYVNTVNDGAAQGEAKNPEYGNMLAGIGVFYYEMNSQSYKSDSAITAAASCGENVTCLRSVFAKRYN